MIIYRLTLILLLVSTFSACVDEVVPPNKKYILDRWQVKCVVTTHYTNKIKTSVANTITFGADEHLQFNKDGTGYFGLRVPNGTGPFGVMKYMVSGHDEDLVKVSGDKGSFTMHIISADQFALRFSYPDETATVPIANGDYYDVQLARR
jgi:hypothetical protein